VRLAIEGRARGAGQLKSGLMFCHADGKPFTPLVVFRPTSAKQAGRVAPTVQCSQPQRLLRASGLPQIPCSRPKRPLRAEWREAGAARGGNRVTLESDVSTLAPFLDSISEQPLWSLNIQLQTQLYVRNAIALQWSRPAAPATCRVAGERDALRCSRPAACAPRNLEFTRVASRGGEASCI
jgi:hypothetical protein